MNWVEWMKGICHIWCRGRLISPSLPVGDDWYLNLNSQKRPPGRNLGEHRLVRRSGTTARGTVVLVFCLRMRSFPKKRSSYHIHGKNYLRRVNNFQWRDLLVPLDFKMSVVWSLELEITLITALPKAVLFNPLLLLLLQNQTYPSCEKESRPNT